MGENGAQKFISYSNAGIMPQAQGTALGVDLGYRVPQFDIEVSAQKSSPYSKLSQNELALQFFGSGFFNPQMAPQALLCLEMMDFDRKEMIMQKIVQNAMQFGMMMGGMPMGGIPGAAPMAQTSENLGGSDDPAESSVTEKARERVAESSSPT